MNSLYRLLWIFLVYAFVGWCVEVIYAALVLGKFVNRGFLNGPVCPIYGFGMVAIITILTPIENSFLLLFLGSVAFTTALEFVVGFILEKFFGEKWWDYSDERLNIKGYVCAKFSLLWGIGCVAVMKAVQPAVSVFIDGMSGTFGHIAAAILTSLIVCDAVITITATVKMRHHLRALDNLGLKIKGVSDKLGGTLAGGTMTVKGKYIEGREQFDEKYGGEIDGFKEKYARELEELKEKTSALFDKNRFIYSRILNAYPKLQKYRERVGVGDFIEHLKEKRKNK